MGPLPDGSYEIEHDGPLASLKTGTRYVKFDKDGKPVGDPIGGKYVFEFDRAAAAATAATPGAVFVPSAEGKYTCKSCGKVFPSLNALGTHAHADCPGKKEETETLEPETETEETSGPVDRRGKGPLTCKGCGEQFPHVNALVKHKETCPGKPPETVAPPASEEVAQDTPA
jgi:hypothetical protein